MFTLAGLGLGGLLEDGPLAPVMAERIDCDGLLEAAVLPLTGVVIAARLGAGGGGRVARLAPIVAEGFDRDGLAETAALAGAGVFVLARLGAARGGLVGPRSPFVAQRLDRLGLARAAGAAARPAARFGAGRGRGDRPLAPRVLVRRRDADDKIAALLARVCAHGDQTQHHDQREQQRKRRLQAVLHITVPPVRGCRFHGYARVWLPCRVSFRAQAQPERRNPQDLSARFARSR